MSITTMRMHGGGEGVPKSIRSVLLDDLVGIRVVLERLGHLSAITTVVSTSKIKGIISSCFRRPKQKKGN
jgi:hypothetical protein